MERGRLPGEGGDSLAPTSRPRGRSFSISKSSSRRFLGSAGLALSAGGGTAGLFFKVVGGIGSARSKIGSGGGGALAPTGDGVAMPEGATELDTALVSAEARRMRSALSAKSSACGGPKGASAAASAATSA